MKKLFLNILLVSIPIFIMSHMPGHMDAGKKTDFKKGGNKVLTSGDNILNLSEAALNPSDTTIYPYVKICCNIWMKKNLDVVTYRNGDTIPKVEDAAQWAALTTGAYCYYNNDSTTYAPIYGKLYNWFAVNDPRGLAPLGWHVPTPWELRSTSLCLGSLNQTGGALKEMGTTHWLSPNTGATNTTEFTALPGGYRTDIGIFENIHSSGKWWNYTDSGGSSYAQNFGLYANAGNSPTPYLNKHYGLSVRIVKD